MGPQAAPKERELSEASHPPLGRQVQAALCLRVKGHRQRKSLCERLMPMPQRRGWNREPLA